MSPRTYENIYCSVARSIEIIGERWTMLILRDAFYGIRRFDDFQNSLGIARNILTSRLNGLVEAGIMRKVPYQEHPVRHEYRVTEKGRELVPVITTLLAWGDKWESEDAPIALIHEDCHLATRAKVVCVHCSEELTAFNLSIDPIPQIVQQRHIEARLAKH